MKKFAKAEEKNIEINFDKDLEDAEKKFKNLEKNYFSLF